MIFGLSAALAWGVADFGAALVSRRVGSLATLITAQIAGLVAFGVVLPIMHPTLSASGPEVIALLANGVLASVAYVALYRGLELGPVALVSPIAAAYAAVTILLAVIFLGESLAGLVLEAAGVTLLGVMLASTDLGRLWKGGQVLQAGIPYALVSMVGFGFSTYVISRYSKELGWFLPVALSRAGTMLALLGGIAASRRSVFRSVASPALSAAVAVGLVDILGISLYARGTEVGLVTVVAATSATFPLIPVFGGVLLLRERPALSQGFGVVLVVGGLVTLALAR